MVRARPHRHRHRSGPAEDAVRRCRSLRRLLAASVTARRDPADHIGSLGRRIHCPRISDLPEDIGAALGRALPKVTKALSLGAFTSLVPIVRLLRRHLALSSSDPADLVQSCSAEQPRSQRGAQSRSVSRALHGFKRATWHVLTLVPTSSSLSGRKGYAQAVHHVLTVLWPLTSVVRASRTDPSCPRLVHTGPLPPHPRSSLHTTRPLLPLPLIFFF